jgi:hypothetical protein
MNSSILRAKTLLLIMVMVTSTSVYAKLTRGGSSGGSPTGVVIGSGASSSNVTLVDATTEACVTMSGETDKYVSQEFLRTIIDINSRPNEISIGRQAGETVVVIPKYISACTDLRIHFGKAGNDFFMRVQNLFEFKPEHLGLDDTPENIDLIKSLSTEQRHERCLIHKGIASESGEIDFDKAQTTRDVANGQTSRPGALSLANANTNESVNLFYASPKGSEYDVAFPSGNITNEPRNWSCIAYENIGRAERTRLRTSDKDRRMDHAMTVCESRDPQALIEEIARSHNDGYPDIAIILERVLENVKGPRVEEVNNRMEEIELALRVEDGEGPSEEQAAELVKEYADLADELQKIQITPALSSMRTLLDERSRGVSSERRGEIDRQLTALREEVKSFSEKSPTRTNLKFVYAAGEKYGLTEDMRRIEDLRLSSNFYSRVGAAGNRSLTIRAADNKIEDNLSSFDRVSREWETKYSLRSGNESVLVSYEREIRGRLESLNYDLEDLEKENEENMRRYCAINMLGQVSNQVRCSRWREDYPHYKQELLERREDEIESVEALTAKYEDYLKIYQDGAVDRESTDSADGDDFELFGQSERSERSDRTRRSASDRRREERDGDDAMTRARNSDRRSYESTMGRDPLTQQFMQPQFGQQQFMQPQFGQQQFRFPQYNQSMMQFPSQGQQFGQQFMQPQFGQQQFGQQFMQPQFGQQQFGQQPGMIFGPGQMNQGQQFQMGGQQLQMGGPMNYMQQGQQTMTPFIQY